MTSSVVESSVEESSCSNPWMTWAISNVFYLYEVMLRVSPSVMTDNLMSHYGITTGTLGVMISFFYYSYTMLQIPCGLILDKLGPRNLIGSSVVLSTLGSVLFALTNSVGIAEVGRCMVGAGAACAFISCLQIASIVFPQKYFAIFAGITNMMGTAGALCGGFPIARSVNSIGWRETIFLLATIGMIIAMAAFTFIPKVIKIPGNEAVHNSFAAIFRKVIRNKQIILSGIVGGFMYLAVSAFSELWAVPFFMAKYNIGNEMASIASSILFIGFAIGSIPVAIIAKKVNGYMKTIRFSIACMAIMFIPLIYVDNMYLSFIIIFFIGIFTAAEVLVFTCARNNELPQNAGTAIAFSNALVMLAGSIFQPILGVILDVFWTGAISDNGVRIYDISCYQKAILTLPICLVIAYVLSIFVKETIGLENQK
ncbi:MAG: MFS transporter [Holosporaceae bacterium]|jgi:predicted MFS family arabinose efflux permease|nr:MFS transporter [Holosporaceae bacterium]